MLLVRWISDRPAACSLVEYEGSRVRLAHRHATLDSRVAATAPDTPSRLEFYEQYRPTHPNL